MPQQIAGLPTWVFIALLIVAAYIAYRWYKHRKATKYAPHITRLEDIDFRTLRDNPPNG
jgi:hypothetical protein